MFILGKTQGFAFALRDPHRDQLVIKRAIGLRLCGTLLATQRKSILVGTGNGEIGRHVFRRLRHGIHTVQCLHLRVNKTPADGRVFHFHGTAERAFGFTHHERRTRHALYAARNHQLRFTTFNRPRRHADGIKAGAAKTVDGATRYRLRQPGQQQRHTRDVAVIFPGLIGAAINHIVNTRRIQPTIALH